MDARNNGRIFQDVEGQEELNVNGNDDMYKQ